MNIEYVNAIKNICLFSLIIASSLVKFTELRSYQPSCGERFSTHLDGNILPWASGDVQFSNLNFLNLSSRGLERHRVFNPVTQPDMEMV